jgi:hypothetical protein
MSTEPTTSAPDPHAALKIHARKPKRAVSFGGGGPAVGISVGFLLALEDFNREMLEQGREKAVIEFPIWFAGCVGGWLTCLYHLCGPKGSQAREVKKQIEAFFREREMYEHFPAPTTFTPDLPEMIAETFKVLLDPSQYKNDVSSVVFEHIRKGYLDMVNYYLTPSRWNLGNFNYMMLNSVMAPNPAARTIMSLLYKTPIRGLNKIWFGDNENYDLLSNIKLEQLKGKEYPDIYLNSYDISTHETQIYCNHPDKAPMKTQEITMDALCASSALPYIFSPVKLEDGHWHSEGALVDSFNFGAIPDDEHGQRDTGPDKPLQGHPDHPHRNRVQFNEIWVSQIVDHKQVKVPENLLDALNNLIMLYAATTSQRDVDMMVDNLNRWELMGVLTDDKYDPKYVECLRLPVWEGAEYYWSKDNFQRTVKKSHEDCLKFIRNYDSGRSPNGERKPEFGNVFFSRKGVFRE